MHENNSVEVVKAAFKLCHMDETTSHTGDTRDT